MLDVNGSAVIDGTIRISSLSSNTSRYVFSDTNGLLYTGNTIDTVPSFYCDTWQEVKDAVVEINAQYPGGNIYVSGDWYMTEDVSWNLTNINFYGLGCVWRCTNAIHDDNDPVVAKKITVTAGSPTFYGITFAGSGSGNISENFAAYNTRHIFIFTGGTHDVIFDSCNFSDIVGGIGTNPVMEVNGVISNDSVNFTFRNCEVASHNIENDPPVKFTYNGFRINITGNQAGSFYCNVYQQRRGIIENDSGKTSLAYHITGGTGSNTEFFSDSSAWLLDIESGANTDNIINQPLSASTISSNDLLIFSDASDLGNIKNIKYQDFSANAGIWTQITDFNSTASNSAITTTSSYINIIRPGYPLRIKGQSFSSDNMYLYAIVQSVTSNHIVAYGPPLNNNGTLQEVYYSTNTGLVHTEIVTVVGEYADASEPTLLKNDMLMASGITWVEAKSSLVKISSIHYQNDSTASVQPTFSPNINENTNYLLSNWITGSTSLVTSENNINESKYKIDMGDSIDIYVHTATGGSPSNNASDLTVYFTFIKEAL